MYAKQHNAKIITPKQILLFISHTLYDDEPDLCALKIQYKNHTHFSRSLSYTACKACETVIKAPTYCLRNLGSELGFRCFLILFTTVIHWSYVYS